MTSTTTGSRRGASKNAAPAQSVAPLTVTLHRGKEYNHGFRYEGGRTGETFTNSVYTDELTLKALGLSDWPDELEFEVRLPAGAAEPDA